MAKGKQYTHCGHELAMVGSHWSASVHVAHHLQAGSVPVDAGIEADLVSPLLHGSGAALHGGGEEGAEDGGAKEVTAAECIPESPASTPRITLGEVPGTEIGETHIVRHTGFHALGLHGILAVD